jgi:hypothetical protein
MPVPALLAGGAMVGGQLAGGLNQTSALRRQNRILAEGSRQQSRAGMEATGAVGDFLSQLRASAPNPAAERGAFNATLNGGPAVAGPGGAQFRADAAGRTSGAQGYGRNLADLFARIRAPGLQRQEESILMGRLGDTLRPIEQRAGDDAYLTNLRAGQQQPNPWIGLLGQGASNWGNYYLGQPGRRNAPPGWRYEGRLPSEVG